MTEEAVKRYFQNTISNDLFSLCVGSLVAVGSSRTVFRASNPEFVYKFETSAHSFQNMMEWETWQIVKDTKHKKWFAPCSAISDCGTVLAQVYCRDLEINELPEELPAFFADVKRDNFGIYKNQIVCRDYGNHFLIDRGLTNKMIKAEW